MMDYRDKHDELCDKVEDLLISEGYHTIRHLTYKNATCAGEIDLLGYKKNYLVFVEVKSSEHGIEKGKRQLERMIRNYPTDNHRVFRILAYYDSNEDIKIRWIKENTK